MSHSLSEQTFVCVDCETTGLEVEQDRIIEVAAVRFTMKDNLDAMESLINPHCLISVESQRIHGITDAMVKSSPKIEEVLPDLLKFIGKEIIIGHGIGFDIAMIAKAAERAGKSHTLQKNKVIDTLRLARLYGESPTNSLEQLRRHFNIPAEGAHRAMNDVVVNIQVFRYLTRRYKTLSQIFQILSKPILLKVMPLGKYKGRPFKEVPLEYLKWARHRDFDQDLEYSIQQELRNRKKGNLFSQASNPFSEL